MSRALSIGGGLCLVVLAATVAAEAPVFAIETIPEPAGGLLAAVIQRVKLYRY